MSNLRAATALVSRWRADPVAFVRENFGVEPDAWQHDALRAWVDPAAPRISLQACAGPGKSAVLAWCGLHFLSTQGEPGDWPKGFACSVTSDNLGANLWPEFAKWMGRSPFLSGAFTWGSERIWQNDHKATWFLEARSWPKTASADEQGKTLSGLHGGYVCALIDESGSIPPAVGRAADQALSTKPKFGKVLQAGNPLSRDGMLYAASRSADWHVIRITGDPDDPKRSPRIDLDWARSRIAEFGRDDPWVMAYILGQFPLAAINSLLSPDEVRDAMARSYTADHIVHAALVLGVDVALEGDDLSVCFPRQGLVAFRPHAMRGVRSTHGAGWVLDWWDRMKAEAVFVDNTGGFGAGWVDRLREFGRNPHPVEFSGEPIDRRYANKRAEMWLTMAEWVRGGGQLPNVPELVPELTVPTYTFKGDRLIVEPKKDIKKRLGRSPDYADALALTFALPIHKADPRSELQQLAFEAKRRAKEQTGSGNPFAPIRPKSRR